jgi:hypothetical protein
LPDILQVQGKVVQLVAVEFDLSFLNVIEAASEPLAGFELEPVLLVVADGWREPGEVG